MVHIVAALVCLIEIGKLASGGEDFTFKNTQVATLTTEKGKSVTFDGIYSEYLGKQDIDNAAVKIDARGFWLVYEYATFNKNEDGAVNTFTNTVADLSDYMKGKASSIRFAGSPHNVNATTLTFYHNVGYAGVEEYLKVSRPSLVLDQTVGSLIITGPKPWQIFKEKFYTGDTYCTPVGPYFLKDLKDIKLDYEFIRSARKGCAPGVKVLS